MLVLIAYANIKRLGRACGNAQARQNLPNSHTQSMEVDGSSDHKVSIVILGPGFQVFINVYISLLNELPVQSIVLVRYLAVWSYGSKQSQNIFIQVLQHCLDTICLRRKLATFCKVLMK